MTVTHDPAALPTLCRSGNPDAKALVLVHGWAQDQRIFDKLRAELAEQFDIYSFDRRGYGASTLPANLTLEHLDVGQLVNQIGKQITLLGFSQGARIATRFASHAPDLVDKLIICGGVMDGYVADSIDHHAIDLPHFKKLARAGELVALRRQWLAHPYCCLGMDDQSAAQLCRITQDYRANDLTTAAGHDFSFPGNVYQQLLQLQIPTLFINGHYEAPPRLELAGRFAASSPDCYKTIIQGAGHMAVLSHAAQVARAIELFTQGPAS